MEMIMIERDVELEKRVISEDGKVKLDAYLRDFARYVGYKTRDNKDGFERRTYNCLIEASGREYIKEYIKKVWDLENFRNEGLGRSPLSEICQFGKKTAEDLNRVLSRYGIKPIPWLTKKYKAWGLVKKYKVESGVDIFDAIWKHSR